MTALQNEIQLMRKSLEKATESDNVRPVSCIPSDELHQIFPRDFVNYRHQFPSSQISTTEAEVWDILQALKKVPMTVELLRETLIGRTVHDVKKKYDSENKIYNETKIMIANWKKSCDVKPIVKADSIDKEEKFPERKSSRESKPIKFQVEASPPQSHGMIRTSEIVQPIPERNAAGELVFPDFPNFRPNLTPKEVLQMGSFGGTYFRPITSSVTKQSYKDVWEELPSDWLKGLNIKTQVASSNYSKSINKYKDTCGGDLEMWESSGWITGIDPYGWFMWYCRYGTVTRFICTSKTTFSIW